MLDAHIVHFLPLCNILIHSYTPFFFSPIATYWGWVQVLFRGLCVMLL